MRKVFLDNLLRYKYGRHKGEINWSKNTGMKINFIYDDINGSLEIVSYETKGQNLYVKYLDEIIHKINIGHLKKGILGKILGFKTGDFKIKIGTIIKDNKRNLTIIEKEYRKDNKGYNEKWYKCRCNICGYSEGWIRENHLLRNTGCACCHSFIVIEGINDIPTTAPWMVKFFQGGYEEAKLYTKSSERKVFPICPNCGSIKDKAISIYSIYQNHSIGCKICGDGVSYPEKLCFSLLGQLNIDFQNEFSPTWCKYEYKNKLRQGKYDFYFELNNKKYIIEMDGEFHFNDNKMNGRTKNESQYIDDEKDRLADKHGIEIIRIDCDVSELEYIKNNILNSKLNQLFDLSDINWIKAEEFALNSLIKIICEYKRDDCNITVADINKITKISRSTICRYLKKGNKIWDWVNYDSKEEIIKGRRKKGKNGKAIEIFKNGVSLGVFDSCCDLERQSCKEFGVKLLFQATSDVCIGKRKQYKGYTFKYVN